MGYLPLPPHFFQLAIAHFRMKAMYFRGLEEKNMVSVHIEAEAMAGLAMAGGISEGEKYRDDTAPKKMVYFWWCWISMDHSCVRWVNPIINHPQELVIMSPMYVSLCTITAW